MCAPSPGPNGSPGTGFRLPQDEGRRFAIKVDSNTNSTVSPGWFRAIRLPRLDGQNGGNVYRDNIKSCGGLPSSYADAGHRVSHEHRERRHGVLGRAQGATRPSPATWSVRRGRVSKISSLGIPAPLGSGTGIIGSAFSPATSSPRRRPDRRHRHRRLPVAESERGQRCRFGWSTSTDSSSKAWAM